ncbi:MAG: 16S rRNA (cytosine(1402)-N(4))-methyltransferase RsmH [Chloroflexi bacterium]|nr:16S rRNA (cytosine(1402)-N(4))-methyltransferase RsmH [Chloroflexota bacterium]
MAEDSLHLPVLYQEVLDALQPGPGRNFIDCTLGLGGHAKGILERSSPDGRLLGIEANPESLRLAARRLEAYRDRCTLVNDNYVNVARIAEEQGFLPVDGVLFDLGISSFLLEGLELGFSFRIDSPLDMRFDPRQTETAYDVVNRLSEAELADILYRYGEEPRARKIARAIVKARSKAEIGTSRDLAAVIERAVLPERGRVHPATRAFQAIRIFVNRELENVQSGLEQAIDLLRAEGRLAVISFHSLEDRVVKQFLAQEARGCVCPPRLPACICGHKPRLKILTKKPIVPPEAEIRQNPRSRSAKLRVAERL